MIPLTPLAKNTRRVNSISSGAEAALYSDTQPKAVELRTPVYMPSSKDIAASKMTAFTAALEAYTGEVFANYEALHNFSVREYRIFWKYFALWSQSILNFSGEMAPVCMGHECEDAQFFPQAQLNYADSLLNFSVAAADAPALTACHADGRGVRWTRGELRERVARLAQALSALGLNEGDRVVAVMRNDADAILTALAVTALGATLSTSAPDMSAQAMLDRFAPLAPRFLFAHTSAQLFDRGVSLARTVAELAAALPSLQGIIQLDEAVLQDTVKQPIYALNELIKTGDASRFVWRNFPFNHPLFVMFSSGTTGKPKCIVHGAGGSLLEHVKEHRLHTDLRPGDRLYFHTSCAWMMWNWQLSTLASGVEIVTYDGPLSTVDRLWRLVADERITVFGTSPAYLRMSEDADLVPGRQLDLSALRAILSTGAVLYDEQFNWVFEHVKPLPLQSICGGTDILGCFVLGNPNLPIYAGEAQCKSLGLDVQAWEQGARASVVGQLVCLNPFPSRPLGFFGDTDGASFHAAYFNQNAKIWTHGDLIEITPEGSARLHGRSDGMLIVRGINVAPNEIYRVLKNVEEIQDAMVVEQRLQSVTNNLSTVKSYDQHIVLLLVLRNCSALSGALTAHIRQVLARNLSEAHVPDRIIAVEALPVTHSGKPSEAAARSAVNNLPIENSAALRNPECLESIRSRSAPNIESIPEPVTGALNEQLEQQFQTLWEKLFGFGPIGCDDNFFELGGNSLLAARFLAEVHQSIGRALPLATLLVAPTIASLVVLIEDTAPLPFLSSPVLLRLGTGTPMFLVHGLSGTVMECWAMVNALESSRPVYGLQSPGLDGEELIFNTVEDMAASYIEQMCAIQKRGPYAIAGLSFGGQVALEIAQQLSRADESIEFLFLINTHFIEHIPVHARPNQMGAQAMQQIRQLPALKIPGHVARQFALAAAKGYQKVRHRMSELKGKKTANLSAQQKVSQKLRAAMTAYRAQTYQGGLIVYAHAAMPLEGYSDPMPLVQAIASGGLKVVEVPDGHLDMVGVNAGLIAAALDHELLSSSQQQVFIDVPHNQRARFKPFAAPT